MVEMLFKIFMQSRYEPQKRLRAVPAREYTVHPCPQAEDAVELDPRADVASRPYNAKKTGPVWNVIPNWPCLPNYRGL